MVIIAVLTAFAVADGSSGSPHDPDSVMATAPATPAPLAGFVAPVAPPVGAVASQSVAPHGLDTDQQIARWLAAGAPDPSPIDPPSWRDDRQPHAEVSVGIGTGGYRDYAAAVSLPIGESGRLDISISHGENGYPYGYGYGAGYDAYFGDSGYAFPGRSAPGDAFEYERRLARPDGPPNRWTAGDALRPKP